MNSLISINHKFMSVTPKRIVELIKDTKNTKGVEAYIDFNNNDEFNYLDNLVFYLKQNNLILQIHGEVSLDVNKQLEYLKQLEQYSDYLEYPIVFTLHTVYDEDVETSIQKTVDYTSYLINNIDNNKIIICLENLNDADGLFRLDKFDIRKTILNNELLFFTYDIGHELVDYGKLTDLDNYMIDVMRNVHIHSNDGKGNDHMPIYENDIHWNDITKSFEFLILNNYKYNIVYEYALELCRGDTVEDKIIDYLKSIDLISEKYSNN